jgi:methionyl-tRNA synthetase
MRKILVTSALPYANGSIHLGHLVEAIQTDIWVRFQKHRGNKCLYMCADDTHGTPIMLSAKKQGITPQELIGKVYEEHLSAFKGFNIEFDNYYTTDSSENKEFAEFIYLEAKKNGVIYDKEIDQFYCENCQMFLPDRFIKGICPACKAEDQYGDACEQCSATYNSTEVIEPACVECGNTPKLKKSVHYFFKLSDFAKKVEDWLSGEQVKPAIRNKLKEWFDEGLRDWDISRDKPYFGFNIPGTDDKFFYVWLDAPIGYISTTKNWCKKNNQDFDAIWRNGEYEIHHFIGKDILYFHTLFWPAMLMTSGFSLPTKVNIHGFLTVNGTKMSKSRGTFINASTYLEHLNPEFLRYYYAAKLTSSIDDLDLSMEDFVFKVNADVVNKVINIGSRLGSIVYKKLDAKFSVPDKEGQKLVDEIRAAKDSIANAFENLEYAKATRKIMALADSANKYIDTTAPWSVVKEDTEKARQICAAGLNALKLIICYLKPVIPKITEGVERFLNIPPLSWQDLDSDLANHTINKYEHLAQRIDQEQANKVLAS